MNRDDDDVGTCPKENLIQELYRPNPENCVCFWHGSFQIRKIANKPQFAFPNKNSNQQQKRKNPGLPMDFNGNSTHLKGHILYGVREKGV
jgi:hypothetical protein